VQIRLSLGRLRVGEDDIALLPVFGFFHQHGRHQAQAGNLIQEQHVRTRASLYFFLQSFHEVGGERPTPAAGR